MNITFAHLGREHLGLEYLSAVLKQDGHSVALAYDPGLFGPEDNVLYSRFLERRFSRRERVLGEIENSCPDLVGFTVYTTTFRWACDIAAEVKQRLGVPVVFGGIHASLVPSNVIEKPFVDYVIDGEGERALSELVRGIESGNIGDHLPNLYWKDGGEIRHRAKRAAVATLDDLPLPDKSLFERHVNYRDDYLTMANRGCVFNCSFCCESRINELYGKDYHRRRSVDGMMQELLEMKSCYGFREVNFFDPIFTTDKEWLREFMERFRAEIGVPFRCFGHASFTDEEVVKLLKLGGCYAVEFGFQTANDSVRRGALHRFETEKANQRAFDLCDSHDLPYDLDHMFSLPGETEEDLITAARYYGERKRLNRIKCHNLTYFPGLKIAEIGFEQGALTTADLAALGEGRVHDFFHEDGIADLEQKRMKRSFEKLYKLLPLIPRGVLEYLLRGGRYRAMRLIPGPLVALGQFLNGILKRDLRFTIYLRTITLRLWRHFSP